MLTVERKRQRDQVLREASEGKFAELVQAATPALEILHRWLLFPRWPWWWFRSLTPQQVFDEMAATSCAPLTVPAPCIRFLYPDDGCWARAHHDQYVAGAKEGVDRSQRRHTLLVLTKNNPHCFVVPERYYDRAGG